MVRHGMGEQFMTGFFSTTGQLRRSYPAEGKHQRKYSIANPGVNIGAPTAGITKTSTTRPMQSGRTDKIALRPTFVLGAAYISPSANRSFPGFLDAQRRL